MNFEQEWTKIMDHPLAQHPGGDVRLRLLLFIARGVLELLRREQ